MTISEMREKSIKDLCKELAVCKKKLLNLRFLLSNGQLTDTSSVRKNKKMVAVINTVISEKQRTGEKNA